jgi:hypothetical protein
MIFPPDGCAYEVHYVDKSGQALSSGRFPDEFAMGAWFREKKLSGDIDPELEYTRKPGGFTIFCMVDEERQPIDHLHPRLVRGRLEDKPA